LPSAVVILIARKTETDIATKRNRIHLFIIFPSLLNNK